MKVIDHTCMDSRLRCVDCASTVCPECMVACPVGNRCSGCADSKPKSKRLRQHAASKRLKAFVCLIFGGICGALIPYMTFGGLGFCFLLLFWAIGREMGSEVRRAQLDMTHWCFLPYFAGLTLAAVALALLTDFMGTMQAWLYIAIAVAFGYFLGNCGFG